MPNARSTRGRAPRRASTVWVCLVLALVATACSSASDRAGSASTTPDGSDPSTTSTEASTTTTRPTTTTTEPTTTTTEPPDPVGDLLAAMSIEDKVGQLLMPVVSGTSAADPTPDQAARNRALSGVDSPAEVVAAFALGGVMYLGPNVETPDQIAQFSRGLQRAAADAGVPPLLIAVDQEGGRVRRIRGEGVTAVGSARSLAGDASTVEDLARITAEEMAALGVNVVFAPVADVARTEGGVIGDRSYGSDPELVSAMVTASINGLQSGGAVAVAKHWPGHGATPLDSHAELPVVQQSEEEWRAVDRAPFAAAVTASVDAVMVGHLAHPALDPSGVPATVSPAMVDGLLRGELGFDGLVVSDALDMGALGHIPVGPRVVQVVLAGVDLLLVPPDLVVARQAVLDAVADGVVSVERLDGSVRRILDLKQQLGLLVAE